MAISNLQTFKPPLLCPQWVWLSCHVLLPFYFIFSSGVGYRCSGSSKGCKARCTFLSFFYLLSLTTDARDNTSRVGGTFISLCAFCASCLRITANIPLPTRVPIFFFLPRNNFGEERSVHRGNSQTLSDISTRGGSIRVLPRNSFYTPAIKFC